MPAHLKRICSIFDELPSDLNFEASKQSGPTMSSGVIAQLTSVIQRVPTAYFDPLGQGRVKRELKKEQAARWQREI